MSSKKKENKQTTESKVVVNKALINNNFESYKLHFDHIISPVKGKGNNQENKVNDEHVPTSKMIKMPTKLQPIRLKKSISNISKLDDIIKRDYLLVINEMIFYYDIKGIYMIDLSNDCIKTIHSLPKDIGIINLSVVGCYDHKSSFYYFVASYPEKKIILLQFNLSTNAMTKLFDDDINDISDSFIVKNVYTSNKTLFVNVLSWKHNQSTKSHRPVLHILSFDLQNIDKSYSMHCKLSGANKCYKCFFDKDKFWIISNGRFERQHVEWSKDDTNGSLKNKDATKHEDDDMNEVIDSDWNVIECLDLKTMNVIHRINFRDSVSSKIMSINCIEDDDCILCVIGCQFSYDMVVFNLLNDGKNGYSLKHVTSFPGLSMIANGHQNKKQILINKEGSNVFIIQDKQYIASFANPKKENKGISDSLQLKHNESYLGTKIVGNRLYCLTNLNFYSFYLPHCRT